MRRRDFLGLGLTTLVASTLGCHPEERHQGAKVMQAAAKLAFILSIPEGYDQALGLALELTGPILEFDYLFEQVGFFTCKHVSHIVDHSEKDAVMQASMVTLQNQSMERLNDRVLLKSQIARTLGGEPRLFRLSYCCLRVYWRRVAAEVSRRLAANLQMLNIKWIGQDVGDGTTVMAYGTTPIWLAWFLPSETCANCWQTELLDAGFETQVQPA